MSNPWLAVPLADYEGHMKSPSVDQLNALSSLFAEALAVRKPASVAILGIAGGNGLERIAAYTTQRILGIDINPHYLDAVRQRYTHLRHLELHCADLAGPLLHLAPVELVHAALLFEHAGTGQCLDNAVALVAPNGALSIILQLQDAEAQNIGRSGYALQDMASHFSLVDPHWLIQALQSRSFTLVHETRRDVPGGKQLWLGIFTRNQPAAQSAP